jgi:hypothetical protein
MRLWIALGLAASAAGCAVIWGIEDKTLVTDSGVTATDAGEGGTLPESSIDSPTGETGSDAGVDAAPDPEPSAPCGQQPDSGQPILYCNDFDTTASIGSTWNWGPYIDIDGGTLAFDTTLFKSTPRSARATAPPGNGGVQLGKELGTLSSNFRVAFDYFIDLDDAALVNVAEIGVVQMGGQGGLILNYVVGNGKRARVQLWRNGTDSYHPLPEPKSRTWVRVVMSYDGVDGVRVWVNGKQEQHVAAHAFGAPGAAQFIVGQAYINGGGTVSTPVLLDNVVARGR